MRCWPRRSKMLAKTTGSGVDCFTLVARPLGYDNREVIRSGIPRWGRGRWFSGTLGKSTRGALGVAGESAIGFPPAGERPLGPRFRIKLSWR